ncbi:uncharacterized protein LOC126896699 [Daktulosphaira vitifoliae]|uniref:uncharacterized protein LOC126896699 n=1 Tax=Daktulosphaira vitifoliae TaxID=58002 RepID=UPI0021AA0D0F|nr:uncharacterized protein LOC126896699 [Daktulosphaira vitifoliae]
MCNVQVPLPPLSFQRASVGRCSVQPISRTMASAATTTEYLIPRSASEHNLCSTIELEKLPPLPPSALRVVSATPPAKQSCIVRSNRDKVVTFEDEKRTFKDSNRIASNNDLDVRSFHSKSKNLQILV